jgi:hypothetical protein
MRTSSILLAAFALLPLPQPLWAQTADDYVNQGRAFLAVTNLPAANNSFSNAVVLSPGHQPANVLYAATRLLVLPSQPVGSNFLSRLGLPVAGRSIYNWTARFPTDTNGVPLAPSGVNADEATSMLRTNILPVLIASEANLAKVTNTNFTLTLTSNETRMVSVTLDYGDIVMLRAMLQAAEYFDYTTYSWNLDAQLSALRTLAVAKQLSPGQVLAQYPELFTFATTERSGRRQDGFLQRGQSLPPRVRLYSRPPYQRDPPVQSGPGHGRQGVQFPHRLDRPAIRVGWRGPSASQQ